MSYAIAHLGAGKTTFIKHLLGREYPGIHIGPEPTTDRFVIVDHALEERRTPGNTLIVQPDKPYQVRCRLRAELLQDAQPAQGQTCQLK